MTIPLTGSGSLFVRLGHMFNDALNINSLRGGLATTNVTASANLATRVVATIEPDYANGTAIPQVIDGIETNLAAYQQQTESWLNNLKTYAQNTLQAMYGIDQQAMSSKSPLSTFQGVNLSLATQTLITQMLGASASVQSATVSAGAQTSVGTPVGNPIIVVSLKNGQGFALQLPFPETITTTCTADSYTGGQAAGNEAFSVVGQAAITDTLAQLYPKGSGVSTQLNAIDGSKSNGATGNLFVNSDFLTASTANYPDNWKIQVGTAGTNVFQSSSANQYTTGGGVMFFTGDVGGTLMASSQQFNTTSSTSAGAGGSPQKLLPNTVYHFNGFIKVSATPSTGALQFSIKDGSGTVIQNSQAVDQKVAKSLTAVTGTYIAVSGSFQTPATLPTTGVYFWIELTTAIDNAKSVYFGRFSFTQPQSSNGGNGIYAGGPFMSIHSGNINVLDGLVPDQWTVVISNSYATSGTGLMQLMMDRMFGLRQLATPALQLPYNASPTVADSLIT